MIDPANPGSLPAAQISRHDVPLRIDLDGQFNLSDFSSTKSRKIHGKLYGQDITELKLKSTDLVIAEKSPVFSVG